MVVDSHCHLRCPARDVGNDFPPVAGREGYRNGVKRPMEHIPFHDDADREWIFGRTALSLFRFAGE